MSEKPKKSQNSKGESDSKSTVKTQKTTGKPISEFSTKQATDEDKGEGKSNAYAGLKEVKESRIVPEKAKFLYTGKQGENVTEREKRFHNTQIGEEDEDKEMNKKGAREKYKEPYPKDYAKTEEERDIDSKANSYPKIGRNEDKAGKINIDDEKFIEKGKKEKEQRATEGTEVGEVNEKNIDDEEVIGQCEGVEEEKKESDMRLYREWLEVRQAINNQSHFLNSIKFDMQNCDDPNNMINLKYHYNKEYKKLEEMILKILYIENKKTNLCFKWPEITLPMSLHDECMMSRVLSQAINTARNHMLREGRPMAKSQQRKEVNNPKLRIQSEKAEKQTLVKNSRGSPAKASSYNDEEDKECSPEDTCTHVETCDFQEEFQSATDLHNILEAKIDYVEKELHKIKDEKENILSSVDNSRQKLNMKEVENRILDLTKKRKKLIKCSSSQARATQSFRSKLKYLEEELSKLCKIQQDYLTKSSDKNQEKETSNSSEHEDEGKEDNTKRPKQIIKETVSEYNKETEKSKDIDSKDDLRRNYIDLLMQYNKAMQEYICLKSRMGQCDDINDQEKRKNLEYEAFKDKVNSLLKEKEDFKCILKEQECQLEEYREKYLKARQTIQEQECMMKQLEMSNKRVEDQINLEVEQIRSVFQNKLKGLANLPKLLEDKQIQLAQCCREKEQLARKLCLVCKEIKAMKAVEAETLAQLDKREQDKNARVMKELELARQSLEVAENDKVMLDNQLASLKSELNTLRSETRNIIARTNERVERQKATMKNRISKLEEELASARGLACCTMIEREEHIRETEHKLEAVTRLFRDAQIEIKTLKNHIQYLTEKLCCQVARSERNAVAF